MNHVQALENDVVGQIGKMLTLYLRIGICHFRVPKVQTPVCYYF